MKKFFTNVPIQLPGRLDHAVYTAVGNERLSMREETSFPILCAVNGYVEKGEEFRLIAVESNGGGGSHNLGLLREELGALCERNGVVCADVETIPAPKSERVVSQIDTIQKIIDKTEDGDELFACVTYGTKLMSIALLGGVRYAYRLRKNMTVPCVVYGGVDRSAGDERKELWKHCVYDETALVQVDELVRLLVGSGVRNPLAALEAMLSL